MSGPPASPLRIAVVAACPFPERRGTPVRIQRLAEGLAARGNEVHVVTYPHGGGDLAAEVVLHRVSSMGGRHRTAPGPSPGKLLVLDPLLVRGLRRVVAEHRIEVIYAHHYEGLLVGLAGRFGTSTPLVYDAHTLLESELPTYAPQVPAWVKKGLAVRLDRWLPPRADHVIAVSETIHQRLVAHTRLTEDRVTTVSNGVNYRLFPVADPSGPPGRAPIVVFAGNLAAYQGIDLLLQAFRAVLAARPDARLRIVTESPFEPYEARARDLGVRGGIDVVKAGFDQVPALLAASDVAVNPRLDCDGIPLKLLNYMAAAKPAVSFRGSAPGVEHRDTGWLVDRADVPGFASGIVELLNDPALARSIGMRARRRVEVHHSWSAMSAEVDGVFRRLLGRPSPPQPEQPRAGRQSGPDATNGSPSRYSLREEP